MPSELSGFPLIQGVTDLQERFWREDRPARPCKAQETGWLAGGFTPGFSINSDAVSDKNGLSPQQVFSGSPSDPYPLRGEEE